MRAWTLLSTSRPPLCGTTVPIWAGGHVALDAQHALLAHPMWRSPADRDRAVAQARTGMAHLGRVREMLDGDVAGLGVPGDPVDRRLQADVDLLLHALESMRFELGEMVAAGRALPADAWRDAEIDRLTLQTQLVAAGDGEVRDAGTRPSVAPHDPAAAAALRASRKAFLARYRGTPFGSMAMLNLIVTFGPPDDER
jgi:hypothetical protein